MTLHIEIYIFIAVLVVGLIAIYIYLKTPNFTPYNPQNTAVVVWFDPKNNKDLCQEGTCYSPTVSFGYDLDFVYYYQNRDPHTQQILDDKIYFDSDVYKKLLALEYDFTNDSGEDVIIAISGKVLDPVPVKNKTKRTGKVQGNVSFDMMDMIFPSNGQIIDGTTLTVTFTFASS